MNSTGWQLERLYKKSDLTVHSEAYTEHMKNYKAALSDQTTYYSDIITSRKEQPKPLSGTSYSHSKFLDCFQAKTDAIYKQLQVPCSYLLSL